jgi:hypothetical protein
MEQNSAKDSQRARLSKEDHGIAWKFDSLGGAYTGRLIVGGEIHTVLEATKQFFKTLDCRRQR